MVKKLGRRSFPSGLSPEDFKYQGRASKDQHDFGDDVGVADMACVDQFGSSNKAKYYHMGVVTANGVWFAYFEWGRVFNGKSWDGGFRGQDFQFVECSSEDEARSTFQKKCKEKNTRRTVEKDIGGKKVWVGKKADGYIVQSLATRQRGLPDAYTIKDSSGIKTESKSKKKTKKKTSKKKIVYQKQVVELARSLVGGTQDYVRAASAATGVIPTISTIEEVRNTLIPAALIRIASVGDDLKDQVNDKDLITLSNHVATLVPRQIPRYGSKAQRQEATILSSANILAIQADLNAFEGSLNNEDFDEEMSSSDIDPKQLLGADIEWIDPTTTKGKWLEATFRGMSNNRHGYIRGKLVIKNVFEISRPHFDDKFIEAVKDVANKNKNTNIQHKARLQPKSRADISDISDYCDKGNVFLGIHGTRSVNVAPILQTNLRLPKSLSGVKITGAAFGGGLYFASDLRKSWGYCSNQHSYYGGGGGIKGRGAFMFLADVSMGNAYMATRTGSWSKPPNNCDSIAAYPDFMGSLANDEHIIFEINKQRLRYIVELDFV